MKDTLTHEEDYQLEEAYQSYNEALQECGCQPKGLAEFLEEDKSLLEKTFPDDLTPPYEEDYRLEEVYQNYNEVLQECGCQPKGLAEFLEEDSSLTEKVCFPNQKTKRRPS